MEASNQIEELYKEGSTESAGKLRDIAETATDKETVKAAKRALYLLSQKHILPPERTTPPTVALENQKSKIENRPDTLRAFASAYDGAGNRLLVFLIPQPDGGYPLLTNILISDEEGIKDYGGRITPRRELDKEIAGMEGGLEKGLAMAEIEADYGRYLLAQAHKINQEQHTMTPAGFLELLPQIGPPEQEYDRSPIYDVFPPEEAREDLTISRDPEKLFERVWFEPWFLEVEEVWPSLYGLMQVMNSPIEIPESEKANRKEKHLGETANELLSPDVRARYVRPRRDCRRSAPTR
jgi:hypothetical protein